MWTDIISGGSQGQLSTLLCWAAYEQGECESEPAALLTSVIPEDLPRERERGRREMLGTLSKK